MISGETLLRDRVMENEGYFWKEINAKGFGKARIRVQLSAAHSRENLDKVIAGFEKVGKELGVI
ncbi:hypothetical protein LUD75_00610 [Epilithonimonas sp. JDS]|uniref:hypothetical protein n=1 Tax=Epilithonimonas sp. JDS TaxID=2902797 RepID=UPI001E2D8958|nr:hypothetical protein [Epilithonimonas sp. JDS]MCD9853190.1 hypothetical protein [Epilithonimonas sp. JDS]